jgi:hypothetical protein
MSLIRSLKPVVRSTALTSVTRNPLLTPVRSMSGEPPPLHRVVIVNPDTIPADFPTIQSKLAPTLKVSQ